jgi:hypothetical protein
LVSVIALVSVVSVTGCSDDNGDPDPDMQVIDLYQPDMGTDGTLSPDGPVADSEPSPDQTPVINSKWTEVSSGLGDPLHHVWGREATDVFAVGKNGTIMKWDGSTWAKMTSPLASDLWGLWGTSQHVFAVGEQMDLYYDGSSWTEGSSYAYSFRKLWGLESGSKAYVVGEMNGSIRHRSVTSTGYWSSVSTGHSESMYGIWGSSESDIFVVGGNGLIIHCAGSCTSMSSWTKMTSGTTSTLNGVWGSSGTDVYAVGLDGIILHYDGTTWTQMTANTTSYFYGVWGSGAGDVYAVGHPIFQSDESIFHYDGMAWTKMPPPAVSYLYSVWGSGPSDVWAVGKNNILRYTGN